MSGIVQIKNCCTNNTVYLGIKNPDSGYGIAVMIEIVAIIQKSTYQTVQVKKAGFGNYQNSTCIWDLNIYIMGNISHMRLMIILRWGI